MSIKTPAFVIDDNVVYENLNRLKQMQAGSGAELLFSIKSLAEPNTLSMIGKHVDGFSTSSLFESKIAIPFSKRGREGIHIVTPGLREEEIEEIADNAGNITYNSIEQAVRLHQYVKEDYKAGIRVNPEISFVAEPRYDPCKVNSKLGVPIDQLKKRLKELPFVSGLHFHSNCESTKALQLLLTVDKVIAELGDWMKDLEWVNIGGGYFYHDVDDFKPFYEAVEKLKAMGLRVIMEPGGTVVKTAGSMVSTVTDMFVHHGGKVVILDTSVNHLPEVLEYNFKLGVAESKKGGKYTYTLAGPTCLAGDEFGAYSFEEPLNIGSKITFKDIGCYSIVKAHTFNGVNVPNIYSKTMDGKTELRRALDYGDYRESWG